MMDDKGKGTDMMGGMGGKFYVHAGALAEFDGDLGFGLRAALGMDDLIWGIGFRAGVDYGRHGVGFFDQSSLAIDGRLTYGIDLGALNAYIGAGAGYELNLGGIDRDPDAGEEDTSDYGLFAGALVGVEYGIWNGLGVYVEGGADYYFDGGGIIPTASAGISFRF
jgi:hypothetical protein